MSLPDALAYLSFGGIIVALVCVPAAAFKGKATPWLCGLLSLVIAVSMLGSLQHPGRGGFIFVWMAGAVIFGVALISILMAFLGRWSRANKHNSQVG